jgi:hypothetical protein
MFRRARKPLFGHEMILGEITLDHVVNVGIVEWVSQESFHGRKVAYVRGETYDWVDKSTNLAIQ